MITASRSFIRMSPRKLRYVADTVRGKNAHKALNQLKFTRRRAAEPLALVLRQAIANARDQGITSDLVISSLQINQGPVLKRFRPVSRGMGHGIHKFTSHILIELDIAQEPTKKNKAVAEKSVTPAEKEMVESLASEPVAAQEVKTPNAATKKTTKATKSTK